MELTLSKPQSESSLALQSRLEAHTVPFLAAFLGCSHQEAWDYPMTFQVFDDLEERRDPRLARTFQGSLVNHAKELEQRNLAGAGVFFSVNETDGAGRSKANIRTLRSWWVDLDGPHGLALVVKDFPLVPSLLVHSGHGTHAYWCAPTPLTCLGDPARQQVHETELKQIRATLADHGADPMVCEVARVMRLPGFFNRKRQPHELVELVHASSARYSQEDIHAAFPARFPMGAQESGRRPIQIQGMAQIQRARAYAKVLAKESPAIAGALGHRTTLQAAIKVACGFDLSAEAAFEILWNEYNPMCQPPWSENELMRKVQEALKVCPDRGWLVKPHLASDHHSASMKHSSPTVPTSRPESPEVIDPTRPSIPTFRLDEEGLWFIPRGKVEEDGTEAPTKPQKLCGPFQVIAETRDVRGHAWGLRLRWQDPDGVHHEETLPRELVLGEGSELARTLIRGGLWVAPEEARRKKLVAYLASVRVQARARSVDRVGWHEGAFVLPGESFGKKASNEQVFLALDLEHAFRTQGSLESWQREVARHAIGNSRLIFSLSVGFAAPLVGRLGMEGGGFHLCGSSSKGKTTCIEAAGSVWGGPVYRETWRATANGLEAVAMSHCDCLLILDEQGQALPREAAEVAYLLANGLDKVRARKTLETRTRRRWNTLFLSTGEITLADRLREEGRTPRAGQDVRLVDIPAVPEGFDQAFEHWDNFETSKAMADHLRLATRRNYGTAARAHLGRLCESSEQDLLEWERRKADWSRKHLPHGADSQVARVLDRFALVALAGELAIEWGILPCPAGQADWAAKTCLDAWLVQRGGVGAGEHERGIAAVLGFIERNGSARFGDWDRPSERVVNSAGFRRRDGQDRLDYFFNAEGWKDACEGFNPKVVARGCADAGLLDAVLESGKLRFQKNVKVPGQGTERFYIVTGRGLEAYRARLAALEG